MLKGAAMRKAIVLLISLILLASLLTGCRNEKDEYKHKTIGVCNSTMNDLEIFKEWLDASYSETTADATKDMVNGLVEKLEAAKETIEAIRVPPGATKIHGEVLGWYDSCIAKAKDVYLVKSYIEVLDQAMQAYFDGREIVGNELKSARTNDAIYSVFVRASTKYKEALALLEKAKPPAADYFQQFHKDFLDILHGFIAATDNIIVAVQTNSTTLLSQSLNDLDTVAIKSEHLLDPLSNKSPASDYLEVANQFPAIIEKLDAL